MYRTSSARRRGAPPPAAAALLLMAFALGGCGEDEAAAEPEPDLGPAPAFGCETEVAPQHQYTCGGPPAFVTINTRDGNFDIFEFEASHPLADADAAFPCAGQAVSGGVGQYKAPPVPTEPCSVAGVRPWHTVPWEQARDACREVGWRLCTGPELLRACQGPQGFAYAYGPTFEGGQCNVRESFRAEGSTLASEAPTGHFSTCVSADGPSDVNGNLWEWIADDAQGRAFQGAGWRTIAQRHQDSEQACDVTSRLPGLGANTFANEYVGFRCCRDASP